MAPLRSDCVMSGQTLWQRAIAAHQAGRLPEAEMAYRQWLQVQPQDGAALHQLALVYAQQSRADEALKYFRMAAPLCAQRADVWNNLGEAERRTGNLTAALEALQRALTLAPRFPEAHFNQGCALRDAEHFAAAIEAFRRAIELRPQYARAHHNLANLLRREGKLPVAVDHYRKAIACQANWWEPQWNLAVTLLELGETDSALALLKQVQPLVPPNSELDADSVFGDIYAKRGEVELARQHYQQVCHRKPERGLNRLRCELLCDPISPSCHAIAQQRDHARQTIDRYRLTDWKWDTADLQGSGAEPPMLWTYHGENERELKEPYARLFLDRIVPVPLTPRPPKACPHIGFLVTSGHEGVFDRCLGGLADQLAKRGRIQISWVSTRAGLNVLRYLRPTFSGRQFEISDKVEQAAKQLAGSDIDILCYWETGTDSLNYFLPFFKPVPLQFATWGWPSTAGHDRIDGYISSQLLEPENGQSHYVEQLIQLDALPTWYERPQPLSEKIPRARWSIPHESHLLVCAQNLRKLHPHFDEFILKLLQQDWQAVVVLLADEQSTITTKYVNRLSQHLGELIQRVKVVPRMPREEYLGLIQAADVVIDSIGYGGGANTALDAAAVGIPVVTLTGPYHRGRWQTAVNHSLGVPELNVLTQGDYASQVLRLCSDRAFHNDVKQRILAEADKLFESDAAVSAYSDYFLKASAKGAVDIHEC